MAAQGAIKDSFSFIAGLNTEGGFFITPENSWVEGENVIPNADGSVSRRNGLDFPSETSYIDLTGTGPQYTNITYMSTTAYSIGRWTAVNGKGSVNFTAYQIGEFIYFTNSSSENLNSASSHVGTIIDLTDYATTGSTTAGIRKSVASFAPTQGKLIITTQYTDPILVTYNEGANTVSVEEVAIKIRDFEEFPSPVAVDVEKTQAEWTTLSFYEKALYNLYNHGWTDSKISTYKTAHSNKLPANTKQWIYGKNADDVFDATLLNKQDFGSSEAPKGRFIIDAFNKVRTAGGTTYTETTEFRPSVCAFFAGRVWYAGINNDKDGGKVFFSQVVTSTDKVGKCYQTNDPTSEVISDLEDVDGGVIVIPEANNIIKLEPMGRGIAVLAANGVWFISGVDIGFNATSYTVEKIATAGCVSAASVVTTDDALIYWSNAGIYAIMAGATGADYKAANISDKTLKSFYNNIPVLNKRYATGAFNNRERLIYWLFSTTEKTGDDDNVFAKNAILAMDMRLNVFYWFSIDDQHNGIPIEIAVTTESLDASSVSDNVLAGNDIVYANANKVITTIENTKSNKQHFVILSTFNQGDVAGPLAHSFADFENTRDSSTKFKDFYSNAEAVNDVFEDAVEKSAYLITGYNMGNNGPARSKTGQYLHVFMRKTETTFDAEANPVNESGCLMQTRWDFSSSVVPGKWSDDVQVYKHKRPFMAAPNTEFDDGYSLIVTKNKLRGRGKAVQFKFTSENGKHMQLIGWSGTFVGNAHV